ncbi:MAG: protoporphyrinogen oxidase [Thermodesulfobacteriota bacterium]|nr:protoporphyrinogen oxidase [Thermodesulfobacteriota bacterium]
MANRTDRKKIIVIGGGITGLSAAFRLLELSKEETGPLDVTLIEARDQLGGVIHTIKKDGFLIDSGPDNFVTAKPWAIALARRLGIESELISTNEANRSAMVVRNGKMMPIPEGFLLMAPTRFLPIITTPLFSLPGKLRMAMELFIPARRENDDESLASFVIRRFGREALDRVVQPLISGIYTAKPHKLSLRATMPRFLDLETKYRSVIRGMRAEGKRRKTSGSGARYSMFVTFRNGLNTLIKALEDRLSHVHFRLGQRAAQVQKTAPHNGHPLWEVTIEAGPSIKADGVIIAGPSKHAATLLKAVDTDLSRQLSAVGYASSAVVHLAYKRSQIAHPLNAFGCVVPITERRDIIAASFSSVKYEGRAPAGHVLLRAFMGGALQPQIVQQTDEELTRTARRDLDALLGITTPPQLALVSRWPDSMAQYDVGHMERVALMRQRLSRHKGLELAGNGFEGVGIPDCVRAGERAAEDLLSDLIAEG